VGAVQKLATVVIVGLVAMATLIVVYLANEPNRRDAEAEEQEEAAIERGIETFLANCVTCHGPGGEGLSANDGRIGFPLGGKTELGRTMQEQNQSEDETTREERYDVIVDTLHNGRNLMPAFGRGAEGGALLNDEQIHELATMIQNVDWDLVYNEAIAQAGGAYPTAAPVPQAAQAQATPAESPTVTSVDIKFEPAALTIPAGQDVVVNIPNTGALPHNFSIDELNISVDQPAGYTGEVTINAPAGTYTYYCNVPGHRAAGMEGTLTVQ
jgi:mono/diheme cytochrome c family protein